MSKHRTSDLGQGPATSDQVNQAKNQAKRNTVTFTFTRRFIDGMTQ